MISQQPEAKLTKGLFLSLLLCIILPESDCKLLLHVRLQPEQNAFSVATGRASHLTRIPTISPPPLFKAGHGQADGGGATATCPPLLFDPVIDTPCWPHGESRQKKCGTRHWFPWPAPATRHPGANGKRLASRQGRGRRPREVTSHALEQALARAALASQVLQPGLSRCCPVSRAPPPHRTCPSPEPRSRVRRRWVGGRPRSGTESQRKQLSHTDQAFPPWTLVLSCTAAIHDNRSRWSRHA